MVFGTNIHRPCTNKTSMNDYDILLRFTLTKANENANE